MGYKTHIPKDLPRTDPILFSFMMILDSMQFQIKLDGKEEKKPEDLPCFSYAINTWRTRTEQDQGDTFKYTEVDLLTAIWKNKPDAGSNILWSRYPDDSTREGEEKKNLPMPFKYEFEQWRNQTFDELDMIISALTYRGPERDEQKRKLIYLPDIYGYEVVNNQISYVYAGDKTPNQFYGVGAALTLKMNYINCCPKFDNTQLTKQYFQSIGFTFNQL